MHSNIEKAMASSEFYSPLSFLRVLLRANRANPYTVIQMKDTDFKDFQSCSKLFQYKQVPFASVAQITFSQNLFSVQYSTSHAQPPIQVDIRGSNTKTRAAKPTSLLLPKPKLLTNKNTISEAKKSDLLSMFKYMPAVDKAYYQAVLK